MSLRFQLRSVLTLFFIAVFAYVVFESQDMPEQARMYPYTISIIALVLLAWQFLREILPSKETESRETGADVRACHRRRSKMKVPTRGNGQMES